MTMNRLLIAASALALFAGQAHAETASQAIVINGDVEEACVLGAPSQSTINLGDMTGADGKLTTALTSSTSASPAGQVQIPEAWCNSPSTLAISATSLNLTATPPYSTPAGFSRNITYNAQATGWPAPAIFRPGTNVSPTQSAATAALLAPIDIKIYDLDTMDATGASESPGLVLEAGSYAGTILLTLQVN